MITFNFEDAIRLRSDTVSNVAIDSVFCVVFVGGNPGGTEGDIYLFSLDNGKIELYIGNTYRSISYDRLFDAVPITKKLYNSNRNGQKVPGWKDFPYCMGHYVFVLDFMTELLVENLKNGDKSRGLRPLAEGVVCTACQCEEALLSRLSNKNNKLVKPEENRANQGQNSEALIKEWQDLEKYIEYYFYDKESEKIIIVHGPKAEEAAEAYERGLGALNERTSVQETLGGSPCFRREQWEYDIALDCVRKMHEDEKNHIRRHMSVSEYHFGYGMTIRNTYINLNYSRL